MKPKSILPAVLCVLWAAALCFPLVAKHVLVRAHVVSWMPFNERSENRYPAQRPSLRKNSPSHVEWKNYGRGLEAWYNDAFPWRTELIRFQRKVSFHWLKTPSGRVVPGRGEWLLYNRINRRLAEIFPARVCASFPWYDDPPPAVLAGKEPGCWLERGGEGGRLDISSPGETQDDDGVPPTSRRFPYTNVATVREGGGISILMAHDSYMRFTLASWRRPNGNVRFPFSRGVGRVRALIFQRFTQGSLESLTGDEIPDVLIEQFPECRLDGTAKKYMDDGTQAATVFGRADDPGPDRVPHAGDRITVRVVLNDAHVDGSSKNLVVMLRCGDQVVGLRPAYLGRKRAVFFDPMDWPDDAPLSIAIEKGTVSSTQFVWRMVR